MRSIRRPLLPTLTLALLAGTADAQEQWIPAQAPCNLRAGHHLVTGAINHLRISRESADEGRREGRLDQAQDVLLRAIRENNQGDNPAAWYYLGRIYVYRRDAWGADSAFRRTVELFPECAEETTRYAATLQPAVLAQAIEQWQQERPDTATMLFHLASSLAPTDPEPALFLSMMYAHGGQLDSAAAYVERGRAIAGDDPEYARRIQQATLDLARAYETIAFENDALIRISQSRTARDTLRAAVARDSALLDRLIQQWAGQSLRPEVQQAVTRDSTQMAERLAAARAALEPAVAQMAADSTTAATALAPAITALEDYLVSYPEDIEQRERLIRRFSLIGHLTPMRAQLETALQDTSLSPEEITQLGVSIFNDGHTLAAADVLEEAASRNAYLRSALFVLCRAYYASGDASNLRRAATRLLEVDPLNPQSVRMMAAAFDLEGNRDSTMKYVALADSGIGWSVTIAQLISMGNVSVVNGSIVNITPHALPPATLEIDFLDGTGAVLGTVPVEIPALDPRGRHQINARLELSGTAAWRYRRR